MKHANIILIFIFLLTACTNYNSQKISHKKEKIFYSSKGFALIYDYTLYDQGITDKKFSNSKKTDKILNSEKTLVMHSFLKRNTPIKIINPETSKFIDTKIFKEANYPKIFNIVISKKMAESLELDPDNPYIEILETKKNKTFIAKESNIFDEEKKVAETAPVEDIQMDDLTKMKSTSKKKIYKKNSFVLVVSDFYYLNSANNLKTELVKKTKISNFLIKKINNNVYRLSVGPFKSFNALKSAYISLNNLGFDELNVHRE